MSHEKFILDATAGFRMMWYDKKQKNTVYLDQRPECEPDVVGDFRDLNFTGIPREKSTSFERKWVLGANKNERC